MAIRAKALISRAWHNWRCWLGRLGLGGLRLARWVAQPEEPRAGQLLAGLKLLGGPLEAVRSWVCSVEVEVEVEAEAEAVAAVDLAASSAGLVVAVVVASRRELRQKRIIRPCRRLAP